MNVALSEDKKAEVAALIRTTAEQWFASNAPLDADEFVEVAVTVRRRLPVEVAIDLDLLESDKLDELLSMPLENIDFGKRITARVKNYMASSSVFSGVRIVTLGQLARKREDELLRYRYIGKSITNAIIRKLKQMGLRPGRQYPIGPREQAVIDKLKTEY